MKRTSLGAAVDGGRRAPLDPRYDRGYRCRQALSMPLYDFQCESCGQMFDAFAAPGDTAPCPNCAAEEARRVWNAPATLKLGLRGRAAKESDGRRAEREHKRFESFREQRRKKRDADG